MEKRRYKRYTKRIETRVYSGEDHLNAMTSDVSERGIFIRTQRGFPAGSVVEIELYLPNNRVCRIKGTVKRTVRTPLPTMKNGMGIELSDLRDDSCYLKFIQNYLGATEGREEREDTPEKEPVPPRKRQGEPTPGSADPLIITCPGCRAKNKVARDKLSLGPRCGRCGSALDVPDRG